MTAKHSWEPDAGPWVAYRDEPNRDGTSTRRWYLANDSAVHSSLTYKQQDAVRFDSKAEALAAGRRAWPNRVTGCTKGAETVTTPNA